MNLLTLTLMFFNHAIVCSLPVFLLSFMLHRLVPTLVQSLKGIGNLVGYSVALGRGELQVEGVFVAAAGAIRFR